MKNAEAHATKLETQLQELEECLQATHEEAIKELQVRLFFPRRKSLSLPCHTSTRQTDRCLSHTRRASTMRRLRRWLPHSRRWRQRWRMRMRLISTP